MYTAHHPHSYFSHPDLGVVPVRGDIESILLHFHWLSEQQVISTNYEAIKDLLTWNYLESLLIEGDAPDSPVHTVRFACVNLEHRARESGSLDVIIGGNSGRMDDFIRKDILYGWHNKFSLRNFKTYGW
eukprot:385166_1